MDQPGLRLLKVLGAVSAIVVTSILGGTLAGMAADGILGTSPLLVLVGFVAGNVIAIAGIWLYIRGNLRGMRDRGSDG